MKQLLDSQGHEIGVEINGRSSHNKVIRLIASAPEFPGAGSTRLRQVRVLERFRLWKVAGSGEKCRKIEWWVLECIGTTL